MWSPSKVTRHGVSSYFNLYPPHTTGEGAAQLSRAITRASEMSSFIFVVMDANGHSPL